LETLHKLSGIELLKFAAFSNLKIFNI